MKIRILSLILLALSAYGGAYAQTAALKTNLVGDALLSPNAAFEIGLAPRWTFDVSGQFNFWTLSHNRRWKHWVVQPEIRYWLCDRFAGHFVGVHLLGGEYNVGGVNIPVSFLGSDFKKLKDTRYQGWGAGAGIAYGYAWPVAKHWNIEAEIGIGWIYTRYDAYPCVTCGRKIVSDKPHNYVGPTKAALNIVYLF